MVTHVGRGGGVDRTFSGLSAALIELFADANIVKHVQKLRRSDADERHLFLAVHSQALPYPVADALMFGETTPADRPLLPDGITHIWLASQYGARLLLGTAEGWASHPYA